MTCSIDVFVDVGVWRRRPIKLVRLRVGDGWRKLVR